MSGPQYRSPSSPHLSPVGWLSGSPPAARLACLTGRAAASISACSRSLAPVVGVVCHSDGEEHDGVV